MPERCDSPGPGFPFPARPAAFTGFSRLFPQRYGFLVRFVCRVEDAEPGNEHLFFFSALIASSCSRTAVITACAAAELLQFGSLFKRPGGNTVFNKLFAVGPETGGRQRCVRRDADDGNFLSPVSCGRAAEILAIL